VIASGMARGIDTAAHEGSIDSGTIAVVAGGVANIYPKENEKLHARIVDQGAVISECKMGQRPTARHFPRRNRIISGLSLGVVVVEAAKKSGSLITAGQALDQGREVFAVPGSPLDPRTKGTNELIRQGATLVESADDILRNLQDMKLGEREPTAPIHLSEPVNPNEFADNELERARQEILSLLSPTAIQIDQIIREAGIPTPIAMTAIFELELAGRIDRLPGNRIALT
jgi:DNA processing protein